jgi:hypothetical protein
MDLWPSKKQNPRQRVLATARFVVIASLIAFVLKRDTRIIALGAGILFILYMMYTNGMIKPASSEYKDISLTSNSDNFMGNTLMKNYPMGQNYGIPSNSDEVWNKVHPFLEDKKFSQHNFFKMPNNNLGDFLKGAYPDMFKPTCRDDTSVCDPEIRTEYIQTRGPARTNNGMY